jgi:hypothetical protein
VGIIVLASNPQALTEPQAPTGVEGVAWTVGAVLLLRLLTIRWAFVTPMALYGSQGPIETLRLSWRATRGSVGVLIVVLALIDLVGALVGSAASTFGWPLSTVSDLLVIPLTSTAVACSWIALGQSGRVQPQVEEVQ